MLFFAERFPSRLEKYFVGSSPAVLAYVGDLVVSRAHVGHGPGSRLLLLAATVLAKKRKGYTHVYIERQEENRGSIGCHDAESQL